MSIDRVELPPALERVVGGIRVTGHRVSLLHVLDAYLDGTPAAGIGELFPTVPPAMLGEVIAFIERHVDLLREYREERRSALEDADRGRSGRAPTLAELRRRRAERVGPGVRDD